MSAQAPAGTPPHRLEADLLLVLTTLIAAAGWIFSKEALTGMPPLIFIGLRFAIAGLVLALFSLPQLRALDRRGLRNSLLVGALFAGGMVLWILGLSHSSHLGEASFISSMGIVMVPVFARLFFGDRPPASTWFALPLALAGFACLSLDGGFEVELGQWFFLGAALVFALMFNVNSHIVRNVPVRALSVVQMLAVGVLVLPPDHPLAGNAGARLAARERAARHHAALPAPAPRSEPDHAQPCGADHDARAGVDRARRGVVVRRDHEHAATRRLRADLPCPRGEPLGVDPRPLRRARLNDRGERFHGCPYPSAHG